MAYVDVVLGSNTLDIFSAAPSTIDVDVDFGRTGERGSRWWTGTLAPATALATQIANGEVELYDIYLNTNTGVIFQYLLSIGVPTFQEVGSVSLPQYSAISTSAFDIASVSGTISGTSTTTTITGISSTAALVPGMTVTKVSGAGAFGGATTITSIDSSSQITITSTTVNTAGAIVFSAAGGTKINVPLANITTAVSPTASQFVVRYNISNSTVPTASSFTTAISGSNLAISMNAIQFSGGTWSNLTGSKNVHLFISYTG